jgi:hypothetical protein
MKSNFLNKIQAIYFTPETHNHLNFSLAQESHAKLYVHDSLQTLKDLCSKIVLDVKQILITCCDIVDMLGHVPSINQRHECIDMRSCACDSVVKLAALMDAYDVDPSNVTSSMIRKECDVIAYC